MRSHADNERVCSFISKTIQIFRSLIRYCLFLLIKYKFSLPLNAHNANCAKALLYNICKEALALPIISLAPKCDINNKSLHNLYLL